MDGCKRKHDLDAHYLVFKSGTPNSGFPFNQKQPKKGYSELKGFAAGPVCSRMQWAICCMSARARGARGTRFPREAVAG